MVVVFGTGHRPEDAGMYFSKMCDLAEEGLMKFNVSAAICGMAAGFDLAFGMAVMQLDIPLWTVRPWAGHKPRRGPDTPIYQELLAYAEQNIVTDQSYTYPGPWVYDVRNKWMVDEGHQGVALWNGTKKGGTYNCLKYAKSLNRPVLNVLPGGPEL